MTSNLGLGVVVGFTVRLLRLYYIYSTRYSLSSRREISSAYMTVVSTAYFFSALGAITPWYDSSQSTVELSLVVIFVQPSEGMISQKVKT